MREKDHGEAPRTEAGRNDPADWNTEEHWWRENYSTRPYARDNRSFDELQPGYRYGFDSAQRYRGRDWNEVEPELRAGWDRYEHRGENRSTWDQIKDSVRDAWQRVTGDDDRDREYRADDVRR
jgi:hypothetical protein